MAAETRRILGIVLIRIKLELGLFLALYAGFEGIEGFCHFRFSPGIPSLEVTALAFFYTGKSGSLGGDNSQGVSVQRSCLVLLTL